MSYEEEHLKHYGVLGMKWGRRKAAKRQVEIQKEVSRQLADQGYVKKSATGQRRMSNKELQARVKRLELEQKYDKLNPKPKTGMDIEKVVKTVGTVAAISASAWKIYENMDNITKAAKAAAKAAKAAK